MSVDFYNCEECGDIRNENFINACTNCEVRICKDCINEIDINKVKLEDFTEWEQKDIEKYYEWDVKKFMRIISCNSLTCPACSNYLDNKEK